MLGAGYQSLVLLKEQHLLLTTKPSLQPQVIMFLLYTLFHAMSLNSVSPKVSFCKEMVFLRRLHVVLKSN